MQLQSLLNQSLLCLCSFRYWRTSSQFHFLPTLQTEMQLLKMLNVFQIHFCFMSKPELTLYVIQINFLFMFEPELADSLKIIYDWLFLIINHYFQKFNRADVTSGELSHSDGNVIDQIHPGPGSKLPPVNRSTEPP